MSGLEDDPALATDEAFLALAAAAGILIDRCRVSPAGTPPEQQYVHEALAGMPRSDALDLLCQEWLQPAKKPTALVKWLWQERLGAYQHEEVRLMCFRVGVKFPLCAQRKNGKGPLERERRDVWDAMCATLGAAIHAHAAAAAQRPAVAASRVARMQLADVAPAPDAQPPADVDSDADESKAPEPLLGREPRPRDAKSVAVAKALHVALNSLPGPDYSAPGVRTPPRARSAGGASPAPSPRSPRAKVKAKPSSRRRARSPSTETSSSRSSSSSSSSRSSRSSSRSGSESDSGSDRHRHRHRGKHAHKSHHRSSKHSSKRPSTHSSKPSRRRRDKLRDELAQLGIDDPFADENIASMLLRANTVLGAVRMENLQNPRNKREAEALAKAIDALLNGQPDVAKELLCRRLAGVRIADHTGAWDACDVLEGMSMQQGDLPQHILTQVAKRANALAAMHRLGASAASATGSHGGRQGGSSSGSSRQRGDRRQTGGSSRGGSSQGGNRTASSANASGGSHKKSSGASHKKGSERS
jgi:hypothetical protein